MDAKGNNHVMSDHASSHRDQGFRDFPYGSVPIMMLPNEVHNVYLFIYLGQKTTK